MSEVFMSSVDEQLFDLIEKQIVENNIINNSFLSNFKKQLKNGTMKEGDWTLLVEKQVEFEERDKNG